MDETTDVMKMKSKLSAAGIKMDFFEAYMYLNNHPMFDDKFLRSLYVEVVKVCPET